MIIEDEKIRIYIAVCVGVGVDIFLNLTRPMAKIHISGAYIGAMQIRHQIEGTMPGGVDNAGGTNANYNKSRSMTLQQIVRY